MPSVSVLERACATSVITAEFIYSLIPVSNKEDVLWHELDVFKDLINRRRIIPDTMRETHVLNNRVLFFKYRNRLGKKISCPTLITE